VLLECNSGLFCTVCIKCFILTLNCNIMLSCSVLWEIFISVIGRAASGLSVFLTGFLVLWYYLGEFRDDVID
jgi:hypothetical protein